MAKPLDAAGKVRLTALAQRMPRILYRYLSLEDDRMEWARQLLVDSRLYFSRPSSFNDPFDCRVSPRFEASADVVERHWRAYAERLSEAGGPPIDEAQIAMKIRQSTSADGCEQLEKAYSTFLEQYGVACFTPDPASMLMWSYYAAGHRGIVVRFDLDPDLLRHVGDFLRPVFPLEVAYCEEFPDFSYYEMDKLEHAQKTLGTKALAWRHEQEWRLVMVGASGHVQLPSGMVNGVIFGLKTPPETEQTIRDWVAQRPIELMRVAYRNRSFALEVSKAAK
jgi:hypothetical protein